MMRFSLADVKKKLAEIHERLTLKNFTRKLEHLEVGLRKMPPSKLRQKVLALLSDETRFEAKRSVPNPQEENLLEKLHPSLKEIFEEYEYLRSLNAHTMYNRADIGPSQNAEGFMRIAWSISTTEIVTRPGDERVYSIDGLETSEEEFDTYSSIYHWVLEEEWICTGDDTLVSDLIEFKEM